MSKTILVLGATGFLGQAVTHKLIANGFSVRILARNPEKARALFGDRAEILAGDASDRNAIARALAGCHGVHCSVGGASELPATQAAAQLAAQHGLAQITYISGATVRPENAWFPLVNDKLAAEAAVINSGVPYVIFRPTWVMEILANFVRDGRANQLGQQPRPFHWVAAGDVAQLVAQSYASPAALNRCLQVYGPEPIRYQDAFARYVAACHPDLSISTLPLPLAGLLARFTGNQPLGEATALLRYFQRVSEPPVDSADPNPFPAPSTTFNQWLQSQQKSSEN